MKGYSVRLLIESGYEIDDSVDRLLHDAATMDRADLMEVLCLGFEDIDVNPIDSNGQTALYVAAIRGHIEALQFPVSMGGDADIADHKGWTTLHCAAAEGHEDAVEFLLNHSTFIKYSVTRDGKTAFALAVDKDHTNLYNVLHLGDVLQRAARMDDLHTMKSCFAEGAEDQNGWTALHRAAFKGRMESVKLLLGHGAQIDLADDGGRTPLHLAVEAGHMQVAMHLMAHGAKPNVKSLKGSNEMVPFDFDYFKNHPSLGYGGGMIFPSDFLYSYLWWIKN